ncbi:hypothetical protein [Catenulispora subtropica]|uniref:Integral membrane protein n=1 Tax=Catenulispora subtropica TaxID=450798 RepID=A0ABP5ECF3_9ACTN
MNGQRVALAFLVILFIVCVAGMGSIVYRLWRGDEALALRLRSVFVRSSFDTRDARVRGMVALYLSLCLMLLATIILAIGTMRRHSGTTFTPWTVTGIALFAVALVLFAAQYTIAWSNRPRFLIPPPMREDESLSQRRRALKG